LISVEVALFATLREYHPHGQSTDPFNMHMPEGSTVADLLRELQIPPGESRQVFVNSSRCEEDHVLRDGERVAAFPPIVGG